MNFHIHFGNIIKKSMRYNDWYFIIILLLSFILIACSEEQEAYYATLYEAQKDNAIERGWMPSIMPSSAVSIYERHFVDSNFVWLKFSMNPDDLPGFSSNLKKLSLDEVRLLSQKIWGVPKWWPKLLMSKEIKKASESFPFIVARYNYDLDYENNKKQSMYGYFFINTKNREVYYIGGYEN